MRDQMLSVCFGGSGSSSAFPTPLSWTTMFACGSTGRKGTGGGVIFTGEGVTRGGSTTGRGGSTTGRGASTTGRGAAMRGAGLTAGGVGAVRGLGFGVIAVGGGEYGIVVISSRALRNRRFFSSSDSDCCAGMRKEETRNKKTSRAKQRTTGVCSDCIGSRQECAWKMCRNQMLKALCPPALSAYGRAE